MRPRIWMCALLALVTVFATACESQYAIKGEDGTVTDEETKDGDDGDKDDFSEWEDATLVVISPEPSQFIALGSDAPFEAVVYDAEGTATDFDEIAWTSDYDEDWAGAGASFTDSGLMAGKHTFLAVAALPNGDRLAYAVGGVLVQDEDAGTYVGEVQVDITADYNGTEYTATCIGAATVIVDIRGEAATGDSTCTLALMGYDMDAAYAFDLDVDENEVEGDAALDIFGYALDFTAEGEVAGGDLWADWDGDLIGYGTVYGLLEVTRISRDTDLSAE